jgi:hypothetical protein
MSISHRVSDIVKNHVTFELECIDRMYLNAYVPGLQYEGGVAGFFRGHRGQKFASSALMDPITQSFVAATERFSKEQGVPLIQFEKGQRKDDVMAQQLAGYKKSEGVVFIGKAQEKVPVFRTEKRRNPETGQPYPWIVRSTAMVNQYYWYCLDAEFGPFFLKFSSYFPYNAKLCLNGHEYMPNANCAKRALHFKPWITDSCPVPTPNGCKRSVRKWGRCRSMICSGDGWRAYRIRIPRRIVKLDTATISRCCK